MSFFCQLLFQASFCWVVLLVTEQRSPEFQLQQSHLLISEGGDKIVHCQLKWLHHSKIPSIQNNLLTKLKMSLNSTQNITFSEALFLISFFSCFYSSQHSFPAFLHISLENATKMSNLQKMHNFYERYLQTEQKFLSFLFKT